MTNQEIWKIFIAACLSGWLFICLLATCTSIYHTIDIFIKGKGTINWAVPCVLWAFFYFLCIINK